MSSVSVIESGAYLASRLGVSLVQANREASASEQSLAQRAGIDSAELSLEGKSYLLLQDKVDDWNTLVAITQIQTSELDALAGFLERYAAKGVELAALESSSPEHGAVEADLAAIELELSDFLGSRVTRSSDTLLMTNHTQGLQQSVWGTTDLVDADGEQSGNFAILEVDLYRVLFQPHVSDGCPICIASASNASVPPYGEAAATTTSTTGFAASSASGNAGIDSVLSGYRWALDAGETLSYSYFTGAVGYDSTLYGAAQYNAPLGATAISAGNQSYLDQAFSAWDNATLFDLEKVQESGNTVGEIRSAYTTRTYASASSAAYAYYPWSTAIGGDIWYVDDQSTNSDFSPGGYGYYTALHEIGHALGLKHTFEGGSELTAAVDIARNSVMTYTQYDRNEYWEEVNGNLVARYFYATTPGIYDVAAMEHLYGTNTESNTGNNTYTFSAWTASTPLYFSTLVDSAGTDTIDASNQSRGSVINLTPGSFSSIGLFSKSEQEAYWSSQLGGSVVLPTSTISSGSGASVLARTALYTGADNLGIAFSAVIENAYGGAGNDTITGNTADNTLKGNGGNDTIDGGAGTADVAVFSGDYSSYTITDSGGTVTVTHNGSGADGTDTLTNIEFIDFADKRYTVGTGELGRAGGLVIPVKEETYSSAQKMARLSQAREDFNAGRLVTPKRAPSAKSQYLSRLAEARQRQFGPEPPAAAQGRTPGTETPGFTGSLVEGHLTTKTATTQQAVAAAVQVTATQKSVLSVIQATLAEQATGLMKGPPLDRSVAAQITQTIKLLNTPNLVALKSITAPEVQVMLR